MVMSLMMPPLEPSRAIASDTAREQKASHSSLGQARAADVSGAAAASARRGADVRAMGRGGGAHGADRGRAHLVMFSLKASSHHP